MSPMIMENCQLTINKPPKKPVATSLHWFEANLKDIMLQWLIMIAPERKFVLEH